MGQEIVESVSQRRRGETIEEWDSHYEVVALPDKDQDVSKDLQFVLLILFARVHALLSLRGSVSKPFFLSNSNERVWEWSVSFLGSKMEKHIGSELHRQPSRSFEYKTSVFTNSSFHRFRKFVYTYRIFREKHGYYKIQVRMHKGCHTTVWELGKAGVIS